MFQDDPYDQISHRIDEHQAAHHVLPAAPQAEQQASDPYAAIAAPQPDAAQGAPAQGQPQPQAPEPYDPLGQGDLNFASGGELGGKPPGSEEYVHELTAGVLNGSISNVDQVIQLAEKYGVRPEDWDQARRDQFEKVFASLRAGHPITGVNGLEYPTPDMAELRKHDALPEGGDAFARAAVPFGLGDELGAGVDTLRFGGDFNVNLHKNRAIRDYDEEHHYYERLGGEIAGALATGGWSGGTKAVAERAAISEFKTALAEQLARGIPLLEAKATAKLAARVAARRAATVRMAVENGVYGAAYGAGSSDGNAGDRLIGAATGGVTGALTGAGTGAVGGQLGRILPVAGANPEGRQIVAAADRQGIELLPADVGGPITRRATSMTAQTLVGGQPIVAASERMASQAQAARDRIAQSFGEALQPEAAGQQAMSGAKTFRTASRSEAQSFYSSAEKMTQGFSATPQKALDVLDKNIAELSATPGGADGLKTLETIRADLASGKTGVGGIRRMRTALRDQFASAGLRGSDIERRVNQVVDAASEDVSDSLRAAGKGDAARLFAQGDAAWRERADTIDNVLAPILGKNGDRSGEQVIKTLTADLQGNNARAVKFIRALPPEEQGNVRASIIGGLGRAPRGQQNAAGDGFSLSTFLSNWNQIGDTAKKAYFGPEARAALNDLAKVAQGAREAQGYANRSNTAGAVSGLVTIENALTGASLLGGPLTFAKVLAAQYGLGRLLASPRFARWLARAPKTSLSPHAYLDRLSRIARAEPAIANDVLSLQARLTEALSGSSSARLAADEPVDPSAGVRENQQQQEQQNSSQEPPQ